MKIYLATTNTIIDGKLDSHYNHMETLKMVLFCILPKRGILKTVCPPVKKKMAALS